MNLHGLHFSTLVGARGGCLNLNNMIVKSGMDANKFVVNLYISSSEEDPALEKEICGVLLTADHAKEIAKQLILFADIIEKEGEVLP